MTGQDFAVFAIVAAAAVYLGQHLWRVSRSQKGCGGCKSCPSSKQTPTAMPAEPQLVQIDLGGSWKRP